MDPDDQQLVGRLEFDVDAVQMETSETTSVDVNSVTSTPWYVKVTINKYSLST